jgi:hypothetical protein
MNSNPTMKIQALLMAAMCAALCLLVAPRARAQNASPPGKLTYQGYLTDVNGIPLGETAPTNTLVIFRIYNALSGGALKWAEQQTVTIDRGHFNVLLGEGTQVIPDPHNANLTSYFTGSDASDRYVEIQVGGTGGTIITPRLQFQPAPYAMLANSARQLVDSTGATILSAGANTMTFGGTVTAGSLTVTNIVATNVTATTFIGNGTIPIGGIIMWSGQNVPAGWTLCNGTNVNGVTVPDLRDKFIVSTGVTNLLGAVGGTNTMLLTTNQVPMRGFTTNLIDAFVSIPGPLTQPPYPGGPEPENIGFGGFAITDNGANRVQTWMYQATRTISIPSVNATQVVDKRPAFYALAFIMRIQ